MTPLIYLDHAASTPLDPRVEAAMQPYFSEQYGNPSSLHRFGQAAQRAVDQSRKTVADRFGVSGREVVFTSGGTESNNLALSGILEAYPHRGNHLIVSAIEHESVLEVAHFLEKKRGVRVTRLPVDRTGKVSPEKLREALTPQTVLVSVMAANNEVGTLQPLAEIGAVLRAYKKEQGRTLDAPPFLHTDACQAVGVLEWDLAAQGVDLLTLNGSKLYGPKGVGALIVRGDVRLTPLFHGGGQENRRRAGTQNVPGVVGLAEAVRLAHELRTTENTHLRTLRDRLWHGLQKKVPDLTLNGPPLASDASAYLDHRLPNNLHVTARACPGEILLMQLDSEGIAASAGSACTSGSAEPSHVLLAMGVPKQDAYNAVRFSLGRSTTEAAIDHVTDTVARVVEEIRTTQGTY